VLAVVHPTGDQQLIQYPTGPGEPKRYPFTMLRARRAAFLPDSRHFLIQAQEPGHQPRIYLVDAEGGDPKPLTPEGTSLIDIIDAEHFVLRRSDGAYLIASIAGGEPTPISGLAPADGIIGPAGAGRLYVARGNRTVPQRVVLLDLKTGREEPWKEVAPPDRTGVAGLFGLRIRPDSGAYAYSYARVLSDLFVASGLK
jgi:hypothetical protein